MKEEETFVAEIKILGSQPLSKTEQKRLEAAVEKMRRQISPEFAAERRRVEKKAEEKAFFTRAKKAGFTPRQARFLKEEFSQTNHQHWDGRIGPRLP